jgi:hypothetical protein
MLLLLLGRIVFAAAALFLASLVLRGPRVRAYPHYGYLGLIVIALAHWFAFHGQQPVSTFFTAIVWTGYIAAADAAVYSLQGYSLIVNQPQQFVACTLLSIPLWLVFEAYNLRLRNWIYVGLPPHWLPRYFGYAWAFATIWPAMLETSQLLRAAGFWREKQRPIKLSNRAQNIWTIAGALMLIVPLILPQHIGAYLFGWVWLGFIFLLEPLSLRRAAASILDDLEIGRRDRLWSLLAAGGICGVFWEFWNYQATAKWIYVFPILQNMKVFEMPLPGFLGFPPFALETFTMYCFTVRFLDYVPDI